MSRQPRSTSQELLVADGDVLGGQFRVGAAQQVLAVQAGFGLDRGVVDAQQPAGGDAQEPVQAGFGGDLPRAVRRVWSALSVSVPSIGSVSRATSSSRTCRSRSACFGVVADHEPVAGVVDGHFLDLHVVGDVGVAALAGQGGLRTSAAVGAQLLADDVVPAGSLQVAAVLGGGEPAVGDPHDAGQGPVPHVVLDLADQFRVAGVAGPGPDPHRDPLAGHGHPDDDLGQVVAVVLALAVGAEPDVAHVVGGHRRRVRVDAGRARRGRPARRPHRSRSRWRSCRRTASRLPGSAGPRPGGRSAR